MEKLPLIRLKPGKEKSLANQHPWVFSGAIAKVPASLKPGDEVIIESHSGVPCARGHFCGPEGIVVRLISFDLANPCDESFYRKKLSEAWALRKALNLPNQQTNAFRFLHGEGDGLPGLVCDIFGHAARIKLSNPGLLHVLPFLQQFLAEHAIHKVIMDDSLNDPGEQHISFMENGLQFGADLVNGQKTGHFLDQRENRALLGRLVQGRRVLDCFSHTGGFSVYALQGGAQSVVSVDISEEAIAQCREHVRLNGPFSGLHEAKAADCFSYLRNIEPHTFDAIVLDPPAFAKSSAAVLRASRGYKDINLLAMKNLSPMGLLFSFSCSQHISADLFRKIIFAAAKDAGREVKIIYELSQGPDHPVSVYCPQSSYLKGVVAVVV